MSGATLEQKNGVLELTKLEYHKKGYIAIFFQNSVSGQNISIINANGPFCPNIPPIPIGVGRWFFNFCHVAIDFLQIVLELHSIVQMPSNHSQFLTHQLLSTFFSYPNANPYIARMHSARERISMMDF